MMIMSSSARHTTQLTPLNFFILIGVIVAWGANFVMVKLGLEQIQPLTLCTLRFLLTSIPAIFFVPIPKKVWTQVISYGILTFALQFTLIFAAIASGVSPGIAALICQVQVFFSIFFACVFAKQSVSMWQIVGALIAFSGIGLIILHNSIDTNYIGIICLIGASLSWGLGNLISIKLHDINILSLVVWSSFIAFFPLAILAFVFETPLQTIQHADQLSATTFIAVAYIAYISTHFGYGCWAWLLNRHSTATIAPFALLCPIVAFIASASVFQETFNAWKIAATLLVMIGLSINLFSSRFICQKN